MLDQTFDDTELVGRPLSLGFNVTSTSESLIFSTTTNTYSPYLALGDDAYDSTHDQIIDGQSFQEVLTSFPFGSTVLTGLFLNVIESGPQGPSRPSAERWWTGSGTPRDRAWHPRTSSIPAGSAGPVESRRLHAGMSRPRTIRSPTG